MLCAKDGAVCSVQRMVPCAVCKGCCRVVCAKDGAVVRTGIRGFSDVSRLGRSALLLPWLQAQDCGRRCT
jgi:hypothetical protein